MCVITLATALLVGILGLSEEVFSAGLETPAVTHAP